MTVTRWSPGVALSAVVAIAVAWNLIGNLFLPSAWYVPANLAVAALTVGAARSAGLSWSQLGLARADVGRGLRYGLIAMAAVGAAIAIGLLIEPIRGYFEDDGVAADSPFDNWFIPIVRIPLGTAVYEEVLFRAVLLALIAAMTSRRMSVAVTSVLFGLWHITPAVESASGDVLATTAAVVGTVAITAVAGVGFALLRIWSGSVLAPILAHIATNSFAYAAALIALNAFD